MTKNNSLTKVILIGLFVGAIGLTSAHASNGYGSWRSATTSWSYDDGSSSTTTGPGYTSTSNWHDVWSKAIAPTSYTYDDDTLSTASSSWGGCGSCGGSYAATDETVTHIYGTATSPFPIPCNGTSDLQVCYVGTYYWHHTYSDSYGNDSVDDSVNLDNYEASDTLYGCRGTDSQCIDASDSSSPYPGCTTSWQLWCHDTFTASIGFLEIIDYQAPQLGYLWVINWSLTPGPTIWSPPATGQSNSTTVLNPANTPGAFPPPAQVLFPLERVSAAFQSTDW